MDLRCPRVIPIFFLIFCYSLYGCARVQLKDIALKPASKYKCSQELSGMGIAVDPYFKEERVIDVFGDNLAGRGYLPVLFVFENRTANRAFLVEKSEIQLLQFPRPANSAPSSSQASGQIKDPTYDVAQDAAKQQSADTLIGGASLVLTTGLPALPTTSILPPVIGLPFVLLGAQSAANAKETAFIINRNLEKRGLVDRTIYPGESHNGFIYFPFKQDTVLVDVRAVQVKLKDVKTGEILIFSIPIRKGEQE